MTVDEVRAEIEAHAEEIASLFKPGSKVTILVRNPRFKKHSADMLVTPDDPEEVLGSIGHLTEMAREKEMIINASKEK